MSWGWFQTIFDVPQPPLGARGEATRYVKKVFKFLLAIYLQEKNSQSYSDFDLIIQTSYYDHTWAVLKNIQTMNENLPKFN